MDKTTSRGKLGVAVAGLVIGALGLSACSSSGGGSGGSGGTVGVSLILKTLSNPYFVSMQKDAEAAAKKDNVKLTVAAGKRTATPRRRSARSTTRSPAATRASSSPPTATR